MEGSRRGEKIKENEGEMRGKQCEARQEQAGTGMEGWEKRGNKRGKNMELQKTEPDLGVFF